MERMPEILAPAGSLDGLYASFQLGADAVYLGTSRFGARAFAKNPSVDELKEALVYAHMHDKKIYLTVNTLLSDRELENDLKFCTLLGIDLAGVHGFGTYAGKTTELAGESVDRILRCLHHDRDDVEPTLLIWDTHPSENIR